jgi:soluble lytic murein transglycosylase-like protein
MVIALSGQVGDTKPLKRPSSYDGPPRKFESIVRSVSNRHGVDPDLVWAVMKAESNFNPRARSRAGARGLMQLMPGTARQHAVADIYDPAQNINGGVRHLQLLLNRFRGNIRLAVAAYNAGARTVARYKGIPPYSETRRYVRRVLSYYQLYSGHSRKSDGDSSGKFSSQDGSTTQLKSRLISS